MFQNCSDVIHGIVERVTVHLNDLINTKPSFLSESCSTKNKSESSKKNASFLILSIFSPYNSDLSKDLENVVSLDSGAIIPFFSCARFLIRARYVYGWWEAGHTRAFGREDVTRTHFSPPTLPVVPPAAAHYLPLWWGRPRASTLFNRAKTAISYTREISNCRSSHRVNGHIFIKTSDHHSTRLRAIPTYQYHRLYRCEDMVVSFSCPQVSWQFQNPSHFPVVKQRFFLV